MTTKREVVRLALEGKRPPYVPWSMGFTKEATPEKVERDLMELVPQSHWTLWSHLLIDHGRAVCKARRPECGRCVLADLCPSAQL